MEVVPKNLLDPFPRPYKNTFCGYKRRAFRSAHPCGRDLLALIHMMRIIGNGNVSVHERNRLQNAKTFQ